jgi:virginiamycin B lyase
MQALRSVHGIVVGCVAAGVALIVASCGQGASGVSSLNGQNHGLQRVEFHITVPTPQPHGMPPHKIKHYFISGGTTAAGVTVTPQGGVPYPTVYFTCTPSSCTGSVSAPVGPDDFLVSLYGGHRISQDTLLSTGTTLATIQPGVVNNVFVTFDPVVSSIALSVIPTSLPPGTPGTANVIVGATDATGNTIIGPGTYVDSTGNALQIDLSNVDTLLNGSRGHSTTLSAYTLDGPPAQGPTQVTLTYDGNPQLAQTLINATTTVPIKGSITSATLIVGASPSPTPAGCSVTATPQPTATFFKVPKQPGNPFAPVGDSIAAGPDGNLWTSDGSKFAFEVSTTGKMKSFQVPGAGGASAISTMAAGPAGGNTVWFADVQMRAVGRITTGTSPSISVFSVPDVENGHQSEPSAIASGPDGNMWFTDRGSDYLGSIAPLIATINEYPIPTNANRLAQGVVVLSNGDLWFVESGLAKLGMVQISALQLQTVNAVTEIQAGTSKANELRNIASSPDGNVWFTEPQSDKVARVDVSAVPITVDEFSVPTANAQPNGIAPGPDGAMWFTETSGKKLGRIPFNAAAGTSAQEFSYGLVSPTGIVTGPDCNLWLTDAKTPQARVGLIRF